MKIRGTILSISVNPNPVRYGTETRYQTWVRVKDPELGSMDVTFWKKDFEEMEKQAKAPFGQGEEVEIDANKKGQYLNGVSIKRLETPEITVTIDRSKAVEAKAEEMREEAQAVERVLQDLYGQIDLREGLDPRTAEIRVLSCLRSAALACNRGAPIQEILDKTVTLLNYVQGQVGCLMSTPSELEEKAGIDKISPKSRFLKALDEEGYIYCEQAVGFMIQQCGGQEHDIIALVQEGKVVRAAERGTKKPIYVLKRDVL